MKEGSEARLAAIVAEAHARKNSPAGLSNEEFAVVKERFAEALDEAEATDAEKITAWEGLGVSAPVNLEDAKREPEP